MQTQLSRIENCCNRILQLDIRVEKDLTALRKALSDLLPGTELSVRSVNGDIVLSGEVRSAEAAENARLIARRFVGDDAGVINMVSVTRPEQVLLQVRITEMRRTVAKRLGVTLNGGATVRFPSTAGRRSALPCSPTSSAKPESLATSAATATSD
jgi:pilus assembly protein CpaC